MYVERTVGMKVYFADGKTERHPRPPRCNCGKCSNWSGNAYKVRILNAAGQEVTYALGPNRRRARQNAAAICRTWNWEIVDPPGP